MILIKSVKEDISTKQIESWFLHLNKKYFVLNQEFTDNSEFFLSSENIEDSFFTFQSVKLDLASIESFWYRRREPISFPSIDFEKKIINIDTIKNSIYNELRYLEHYVYKEILKIVNGANINSPDKGDLNRLQVFSQAKRLNIITPEFIITNKKVHVSKFFHNHKKIVIKPISNAAIITKKDGRYIQYTKLLTKKDISTIPTTFFPSLFQAYKEKEFEIRTFYLNEKFYSMAMFTQSKKQTQVDFRRYDFDDPVRTVPYKLPSDFENKLKLLFRKLDVNCGSVDILYTKTGEYVFLEINPVGQFGMVSYPCNYFLERLIAKELIKNEQKSKRSKN